MGTGGASLRLLVSDRPSAHSRQSEREAANELPLENQSSSALAEGGRWDGGGTDDAAADPIEPIRRRGDCGCW